MKKLMIVLFICLFLFPPLTNAMTLTERLSGKILLQVESKGEAWYVNPNNNQRYYLGRPDDAFRIMRELGLGIKHDELEKYKKSTFPKKFSGKIFLDVEEHGEAYYVYPVDLKAYYLGRPDDAFQIMREKGLGITNNNLDLIQVNSEFGYKDESYILATESTESLYPINLINNPKWEIEIVLSDGGKVNIVKDSEKDLLKTQIVVTDESTGVISYLGEYTTYLIGDYLDLKSGVSCIYPNLKINCNYSVYRIPAQVNNEIVEGKLLRYTDSDYIPVEIDKSYDVSIIAKSTEEKSCNVRGIERMETKIYYTIDSEEIAELRYYKCFVTEDDAIKNGYIKALDN